MVFQTIYCRITNRDKLCDATVHTREIMAAVLGSIVVASYTTNLSQFFKIDATMNKLTDFFQVPHLVFDCKELDPSERFMLLFIIESCNQHRYEGEYVGIPRADFANFLGIVDDKKYYRVRHSLVNLGLIDVKQGGRGNATKFKVLYDNIYKNLTKVRGCNDFKIDETEEDAESVNARIVYPQIKKGDRAESSLFPYFRDIYFNYLKNDNKFCVDEEYTNKVMDNISCYFAEAFKYEKNVIRYNLEKYKEKLTNNAA